MRLRIREVAGVAMLLLLIPTLATSQPRRFREDAAVVVVEIPVQVLEGGEVVRGLTADDFEVREGSKKLPVVGFDVLDLSAVGDGEGDVDVAPVPGLPISARRHFVMLFDLSFSSPESILRARQAARELVLDHLHPADLVAVATFSQRRGLEVPLIFSSDRDQIALAVDTLGLADPFEVLPDPLGMTLGALEPEFATRRSASGAFIGSDVDLYSIDQGPGYPSRRAPDANQPGVGIDINAGLDIGRVGVEAARDLQPLGERTVRDQMEGRILSFTGAMDELARLLESASGRVHLVLLSEGFDSAMVLGNQAQTVESRARLEQINQAAASGEMWRVDNDVRFGSSVTRNALFETLGRFRSTGVTIQAVDIGGVRAGVDSEGQMMGQNALFTMAKETGGELYRNTNDLGAAMGEMLERTSHTYVLAVQPKDLEADGSFHRIEVRLKKGRPGTRVLHRPGYTAPRPLGSLDPGSRRLLTAGLVLGGATGGSLPVEVLAPPFVVADGPAYVPVFIEIEGDPLLAGSGNDQIPLEIYAYAFDHRGKVRDYFAQAVGIDVASSAMVLSHSGYKFWGHFDLPAGDYLARILVRNAATGATGLVEVPIAVPEAGAAGPRLLPPFAPEPTGRWVLGRERTASERPVPYPFRANGGLYMPAARPVVHPGLPTDLRLMGYGLEGAEIDGRIVDGGGNPVASGRFELGGPLDSALPGLVQLAARLEIGEVDPGVYWLRVTARGGDGGVVSESELPFVVR